MWLAVVFLLVTSSAPPAPAQRIGPGSLANRQLRAEFGPRGLASITAGGHAYRFSSAVTVFEWQREGRAARRRGAWPVAGCVLREYRARVHVELCSLTP
jgi:hypothetical protein